LIPGQYTVMISSPSGLSKMFRVVKE